MRREVKSVFTEEFGLEMERIDPESRMPFVKEREEGRGNGFVKRIVKNFIVGKA